MPSAPNLNPPASSVAVHAAIFRHPMWALTPQRGENPNPERGSEQVKCVPARAAAEFHGALNRGVAVELTREPGERIGVMGEDLGSVDKITAGRSELHEPEWRRTMAKKSSWQCGEDDTEKVSGEPIEQAHDEERDRAEAENLARRPAGAAVSQSERDWAWWLEATPPWAGSGPCPGPPGRGAGQRSTPPGIRRAPEGRARLGCAYAGNTGAGDRTLMDADAMAGRTPHVYR